MNCITTVNSTMKQPWTISESTFDMYLLEETKGRPVSKGSFPRISQSSLKSLSQAKHVIPRSDVACNGWLEFTKSLFDALTFKGRIIITAAYKMYMYVWVPVFFALTHVREGASPFSFPEHQIWKLRQWPSRLILTQKFLSKICMRHSRLSTNSIINQFTAIKYYKEQGSPSRVGRREGWWKGQKNTGLSL